MEVSTISAYGSILQLRGIGDAPMGFFSSYAYILLVLHYLQRTEPPVIPILQDLYDGDNKPVKEVEGWNAWFYRDIENIVS